MAKMRCGIAAVEALRTAGVTTIFGLMGSSTLEIYDVLYDAKDLTYIGVRHENCGMHMADAYGRVTQRKRNKKVAVSVVMICSPIRGTLEGAIASWTTSYASLSRRSLSAAKR